LLDELLEEDVPELELLEEVLLDEELLEELLELLEDELEELLVFSSGPVHPLTINAKTRLLSSVLFIRWSSCYSINAGLLF
jgi:hypothetical protein